MRGRPGVSMRLRPGAPVAGSEVVVETVLSVPSRTPVDAVEVRLTGYESFALQRGHARVARVTLVDLVARFAPGTLEPGEHRLPARFALPAGAPGAYAGRFVAVTYEASVAVMIPWWPDRHARFWLPVRSEPRAVAPRAVMFASRVEGPGGGETYAELSLERGAVPPGGVVQGALSLVGASPRTRRVRLDLVLREGVRTPADLNRWLYGERIDHGEQARYGLLRHEGVPGDGQSLPFRVRLPADLPPTCEGRAVDLRWALEVTAEVPLGRDFVWSVPLAVPPVEPSTADLAAPPLEPAPLVGHERRARLWQGAARQLGLPASEAQEQMTGEEAGARFRLRLEARPGGALVAVAAVEWPPLDGAFELRERRWADLLDRDIRPVDRGPFDERFGVSAARAEVVAALLTPDLRARLLRLAEVHLDAHGAQLAAPVDVRSAEALAASLGPLVAAVRGLCLGRDAIAGGGSPYR